MTFKNPEGLANHSEDMMIVVRRIKAAHDTRHKSRHFPKTWGVHSLQDMARYCSCCTIVSFFEASHG